MTEPTARQGKRHNAWKLNVRRKKKKKKNKKLWQQFTIQIQKQPSTIGGEIKLILYRRMPPNKIIQNKKKNNNKTIAMYIITKVL